MYFNVLLFGEIWVVIVKLFGLGEVRFARPVSA